MDFRYNKDFENPSIGYLVYTSTRNPYLKSPDIIRYLVFFLVFFVFTAIYRIKEVKVS
jgi:hypothetical protein